MAKIMGLLLMLISWYGEENISFVQTNVVNNEFMKQEEPNTATDTIWRECGTSYDPVHFRNITIQPSPVTLPGEMKLGLQFMVTQTLHAPITVRLNAEKQIAKWVPVFCSGQLGSCEISDFCSILPFICPNVYRMYGFPCQCPIPRGVYNLREVPLTVSPSDLPVGITATTYRLTFNLTNTEKHLGCIYLEFSVLDP